MTSNNPKKLNQLQLLTFLQNLRGAKIVSIISKTEPELLSKSKSYPYYGRIAKLSYVNGIVGFIYENSVNNQRVREGNTETFTSEPRKWGQRLFPSPLVEHKGVYYLEIKVQKVLETKYLFDGEFVDYNNIKEYLKPKKIGESSRQEITNEVILRDYKLSSILQITIDGEIYIVS